MTLQQIQGHHQFLALAAGDKAEATSAFIDSDWADLDHWHDWHRSVRDGVSEPAASARQTFAAGVWCYAAHDHDRQ